MSDSSSGTVLVLSNIAGNFFGPELDAPGQEARRWLTVRCNGSP